MLAFQDALKDRPRLIGVVHVPALPGAPAARLERVTLEAQVVHDATAYADGGADALLLENFGDAPFGAGSVEPHVVAWLTRLAGSVERAAGLPLGVNVLRNDACAALGVASALGAAFVRVNVLAGVVATDQGLIEGRAARVVRYRQRVCPEAALLADLDVKHGRQLWGGSVEERAFDLTHRAGADALLVTGVATGRAPAADAVARVREAAAGAPVLIASGVTAENAAQLLPHTQGCIVGTSVKAGGAIAAPVDVARVRRLVEAARAAWA